MTVEAFAYTQQLWLLFSQKLVVLERLMELCELQSQSDLSKDVDVLNGWLARKQPLMEELALIQHQLSVYANDDPDERVWYSQAERQQCRQMAQTCQALLTQILALEQQSIDDLSQRREAIAGQLQEGRDRMLARTLYQEAPVTSESSFDLGSI